MLVGFLEEIEIEPTSAAGRFKVHLRHREPEGRLYTVQVTASQVVTHDLDAQEDVRGSRRVIRFPKIELAAFMDGDILRVCPRDGARKWLAGQRDSHEPTRFGSSEQRRI